ncbi:MAG TPA: hypothetical protein VIB11_11820 [Pedococcus sp.]|uniref:TolB family protein n=1 Tax=Pedococcus sp. TaxID=2860345 RepID=UPI002F923947
MSARARLVAVLVVIALLVGATAAYLLAARATQQRLLVRTAPAQQAVPVSEVRSAPHIVFRHTAAGAHRDGVALVPLADPGGQRAFSGLTCERVYAAGPRTLCLAPSPGIASVYRAQVRTEGGAEAALTLTGTPSRARLSADGGLAATTSFVSGDSYAADGFSTRTVVTPLSAGDPVHAGTAIDLESFRLVHRGAAIRPADRNYWGVTFAADHDRFFVTVAFGGQTWLARGSLTSRTLTTLRADAECPSLSPDGRRVAYKKQEDRIPGDWRLAVLDLASGKETMLAEDRSVDDQVEWLDNDQLLYAVPRAGSAGVLGSDVWRLPADGTGAPSILIEDAASPAVQR